MRLTLRLLGLEVLDLNLSTDAEPAAEGTSLDGGTTASTPINVAYRPGEEAMGDRPEWD